MMSTDTVLNSHATWYSEHGIPFRSLWTLLVYASDLARFQDRFEGSLDGNPELPEVLARFLVEVTERRLRRSLSRGYEPKQSDLARVRGRIDWLGTSTRMLPQRGLVACRYEDFTADTPRNRLIRVALERMASCVRDKDLRAHCKRLVSELAIVGVRSLRPTEQSLRSDPVASHQADDHLVLAVARMVLDLVLPGERDGTVKSTRLERDETLLWKIFEKGVAGFLKHRFHRKSGWRISTQQELNWDIVDASPQSTSFMPIMKPDLTMRHASGRCIVLDTKFSSILTKTQFGNERFKSNNIYQLYAYLRSQEKAEGFREGVLLYPSIDIEVDEHISIQGHTMRFLTVNLGESASDLFAGLSKILGDV